MQVGDRVRLLQISPHLIEGELHTRSVFEQCLGHVFTVQGFDDGGWIELVVDSVTGNEFETIWIEPEYVELIEENT